jgi:cell division protease FtsH
MLILFFRSSVRRANQRDGDSSGGGLFDPTAGMGKSLAKVAKSSFKFSDVAGIKEEKSELIEIVDYLKRPAKYASMGARTPRGVVLYGPPGTGKTLLAKAVAGEAGVPFMQVSGSAFEEMLVGVGAKRVRDLFNKAKKAAPCIIFIDEIDTIGAKRSSGNSITSAIDQTLNQLLAEMDGFETTVGVIVMAATNRIDILDDALLRPGRFDRHIQISLPDIKERIEILKLHSKNKNISSRVNFDDIARRTPGFSGAQLENTLNEATLLAVRGDRNVITTEDIDEAIDRVIGGPAKKSRVTTFEEKKQIAVHEAGHAIVGIYSPGADIVQKITIIPRGQAGGYTMFTPEKQEMMLKKKSDITSDIATSLGGRAAEEIVYGKNNVTTGASNDFFKATTYAKAMVTKLGMSNLGIQQYSPTEGPMAYNQTKDYSEKTAQEIDNEVNSILQEQYVVAKKAIVDHFDELDLIVQTLLILETIVREQIEYIHTNKKLPEAALERISSVEGLDISVKLPISENNVNKHNQTQVKEKDSKNFSVSESSPPIASIKNNEKKSKK